MARWDEIIKLCLTVTTGLIECFGFAGVVGGWPSLVYVLRMDEYFAELCETAPNFSRPVAPNTTVDCTLQSERFTLIYTFASSTMNVATIANGYIFDYCGTMVTRFLAISVYTAATLMIAFSTAATAILLFPALLLLGVASMMLLVTNIQVGNLLGNKRSTVITLYYGAFNSSPAVFLIVKVLYESNISLRSIFLVISGLSLIHVLRTIFLLPRTHIPYFLPPGYSYGMTCEIFTRNTPPREEGVTHQSQGAAESGGEMIEGVVMATGERREEKQQNTEGDTGEAGENEQRKIEEVVGEGMEETDGGERGGSRELQGSMGEGYGVNNGNLEPNGTEDLVARDNQGQLSFKKCLLSRLFFAHVLWVSIIQLRHLLFVGTLNQMLHLLADGDPLTVSKFTNAFAITQLCSILSAPWNGLILDRHKLRARPLESGTVQRLEDIQSSVLSLAITVTLSTLFSIFAAIPVLEVQYATFILLVTNATFLYGSDAAFLAIAFPACHFGKLYGVTQALAGVVSLLQYPCAILVSGPLRGDPLYLNLGVLVLVTLAFAHPLIVHFWCRRERLKRSQ
ncbi:solute carrier family 43 member 3-like [Amblyraja radiata]|uniref:solute carrier family 43 member 3-like n=1 Tax=Amblyraja radiata TaxID=386614 RepID=UPI0014026F7B|nr:solute carrier family 43 member 3-like [Amblyraja radiata]